MKFNGYKGSFNITIETNGTIIIEHFFPLTFSLSIFKCEETYKTDLLIVNCIDSLHLSAL